MPLILVLHDETRNELANDVHDGRWRVNALVVIPARMSSQRLPGKPLADIAGLPMIAHVWRAARAANVGPVVVAAAEQEIVDAVQAAGGNAVLTDPNLPSGSDRVWAGAQTVDPDGQYPVVVNVQGDMPALSAQAVTAPVQALTDGTADIATPVAATLDAAYRDDPNTVKAIVAWNASGLTGQALYFTRAPAPWGDGPIWRHLGVYAYRREALARFTSLPPSALEHREKLEQLRALEAGLTIDAAAVDRYCIGVDTPEDLARARTELSQQV